MPGTLMVAAALASMAIVGQDNVQLRAAPRDSAQQQAILWQGDSLEIRGVKGDYLQVYDHRRERAGYVRATQARPISLKPADAGELLAVVRFLKDTPGAEALGIAYTAAYLKAAPAAEIGAETFDALGGMAERLGRRASIRQGKALDPALAAHMEVVQQYGVVLRGYENDGRIQLCYDGDAYRRVLALPADPAQQARAALGLTRQECLDPAQRPSERRSTDVWRAQLLDQVAMPDLAPHWQNRIQMRRANVWAALAFDRARQGLAPQEAGQRALDALASVSKIDLADEDQAPYAEAAVRVGSTIWAGQPVPAVNSGLRIVTASGQPGETCVSLVAQGGAHAPALASRCTYGIVWPASARANATGSALTLAVQPMAAWREMWLFRQDGKGWSIDVLPPSSQDPALGYAEFAGWVPGTPKMLVVREARVEGRIKRRFEVLDMTTLAVEKSADKPEFLTLFHRWQDPRWQRATVSLR
ncbi:hypothetical protein [Massilia sp. CF038]|uniref:hypothetical protein n=1 Tax=Massilia sp. CF038 TaxID=1881045 RepID=UPI00092183AB|nr:hypothetical protein SAMN05428948_5131 [Massilia sp. CF038]